MKTGSYARVRAHTRVRTALVHRRTYTNALASHLEGTERRRTRKKRGRRSSPFPSKSGLRPKVPGCRLAEGCEGSVGSLARDIARPAPLDLQTPGRGGHLIYLTVPTFTFANERRYIHRTHTMNRHRDDPVRLSVSIFFLSFSLSLPLCYSLNLTPSSFFSIFLSLSLSSFFSSISPFSPFSPLSSLPRVAHLHTHT